MAGGRVAAPAAGAAVHEANWMHGQDICPAIMVLFRAFHLQSK